MSQIDYGRILCMNGEFSRRKIASSVHCSRDTVARVLNAAKKKGVSSDDAKTLTNAELEEKLFPGRGNRGNHEEPDYAYVHGELAKPGVTMTLLHSEYCEHCSAQGLIPYGKSQFNKKYRDWAKCKNVTMRITHKPGDELQVDWAGDTMDVRDEAAERPMKAHLFVGCLPFSVAVYAEAFPNEKLESWIQAHVHMFEYFGGVPRILVPDNLKTGIVSHPTTTQFKVNSAYQDMGDYYRTKIIPARPRMPKDKAAVERSVGIVETWVIAALRDRVFSSFCELNKAIREQLEIINSKPFQNRSGSRWECFVNEEQPFLLPLPAESYDTPTWEKIKVPAEYLIPAGGRKYSVPYEFVGETVEVRLTSASVDVFSNGQRIAHHTRIEPGYDPVYAPEHMPGKHREALRLNNPATYLDWAVNVGKSTEQAVNALFRDEPAKYAVLRSRQLMELADRFSDARLEAACQAVLTGTGNPDVELIESILEHEKDDVRPSEEKMPQPESSGITRGAAYYRRTKS